MTKAILTTSGDREIRVERVFEASRERVWRALTDRAQLAQWWGRGNKLVITRYDFRRGGHWRFVEHSPQGKHGFEGRFSEIDAPYKLIQTFEWDGMPGHACIQTMTLEELGAERTKLVTVSLFMTGQGRDGMMQGGAEAGMNQSYDALDRVLERPAATSVDGVKRIAFTMYPIVDAKRARVFYEDVLGLRPNMVGAHGEMVWIEYDLPGGGCFALTNTTGNTPSAKAGGTIALEVVDLPATIARLKEHGIELLGGVVKGPHCTMQVCLDSEGNSVLLHQLDSDELHAGS